jgi:hypothetical protein
MKILVMVNPALIAPFSVVMAEFRVEKAGSGGPNQLWLCPQNIATTKKERNNKASGFTIE